MEVKNFINKNVRDRDKLRKILSKDVPNYTLENIRSVTDQDSDYAWWIGNTKSEFSVKSAFNSMKRKIEEMDWLSEI